MLMRFSTHARVYLIFLSAVLFSPRDARKLASHASCSHCALENALHVDLHQRHLPSINLKIL